MKFTNAPYMMGAYSYAPSCAEEDEHPCKRANFLENTCTTMNPYARAYVVSQVYANCASPECAVRNGTFFNDLYMPYTNMSHM